MIDAAEVRFSASLGAPPQFWSGIQETIAAVTASQPAEKMVVKPGNDATVQFRFLFVNELEFQPDGRMVLTGDYGKLNEKIIVAKRLIIPAKIGPGADPLITWARGSQSAPVPAGKAPSAVVSRFPGERVQSGMPGAFGNTGFPGRDAPNLILVVKEVVAGGPLRIDLRGQDGGRGGDGQGGGDGALGRPGSPGLSVLFGCKGSPEPGSDGGAAGNGGVGGPGGRGGSGGSLVVFGDLPTLKALEPSLLVDVDAGAGGQFGRGGSPGVPGAGGAGARPMGHCTAETPSGKDGAIANKGADGQNGPSGAPGDVRSFVLTPELNASIKL